MTAIRKSPHAPHGLVLRRRPGVAMLIVLAALVVVSMLAVSMTQTVVARHRLQRAQLDHLQTRALTIAGVDRAAARLANSRKYRGEIWKPGVTRVGGDDNSHPARVVIDIRTVDGQPARRNIRVRSSYGDGPTAITHTHQVTIDLDSLATEN